MQTLLWADRGMARLIYARVDRLRLTDTRPRLDGPIQEVAVGTLDDQWLWILQSCLCSRLFFFPDTTPAQGR